MKRETWWNVQHKAIRGGTWNSTALFSKDRKYLLQFVKEVNDAAKKRGDENRDRVVKIEP